MTTHTLTTEQLKKLVEAIGYGNNFPKHTNDPQVNHAVDCVVSFAMGDEEPEYDAELYARDAAPITLK